MSAPPAQRPPPSGPWQRVSSLRIRIGAAVVAVAMITLVFVVVVHSGNTQPDYTSVPASCALISPATVAKYLPDPTRTPESTFASSSYQAGSCKWTSNAGGQDRTLVAQAFVFDSSSPITAAKQAYSGSLGVFGCHCQGVKVSTRPLDGLGDQAMAFYITAGPDATVATAPNAAFPGTNLLVRSSNAEIALNYDVTTAATGTALAPAAGPLTGMITMAQDILDSLAQPSAVAAVPVSPEPHYAAPRDPCSLITPAMLATYVPGVTARTVPTPSAHAIGCSWGGQTNSVFLTLSSFPDAVTARENFEIDAQANSRSIAGQTVTGSVWLPDLGEDAAAIFQTLSGGGQSVAMIVWSGNLEISIRYTGPPAVTTPTTHAKLLAGAIAMARGVLAGLDP
jgi:hypothetical protein